MNRRDVIKAAAILSTSDIAACPASVFTAGRWRQALLRYRPAAVAARPLTPSGPITSHHDGQVIEGLDVEARQGTAVTILHHGVTVRNCRIRHAGGHGLHGEGATGLVLQDLEIDRPDSDAAHGPQAGENNNIDLVSCSGVRITRVRACRGSSNVYMGDSAGARLAFLELHDARGPFPRGQNVQFDQSSFSVLEDFSAENGPASWTEDNVSVFRSDGCMVRRGLVSYNNSPTGDGVMLEGSFDCLVEDVDAVEQGNGAFAAVPEKDAGSGGCVFRRCRTRATYNSSRDGRAAPTSNGLSFYMRISAGARKHTIDDCFYDALANPENLIWELDAVRKGWRFGHRAFVPRSPLRLTFFW